MGLCQLLKLLFVIKICCSICFTAQNQRSVVGFSFPQKYLSIFEKIDIIIDKMQDYEENSAEFVKFCFVTAENCNYRWWYWCCRMRLLFNNLSKKLGYCGLRKRGWRWWASETRYHWRRCLRSGRSFLNLRTLINETFWESINYYSYCTDKVWEIFLQQGADNWIVLNSYIDTIAKNVGVEVEYETGQGQTTIYEAIELENFALILIHIHLVVLL
jgi:hypothetical protein